MQTITRTKTKTRTAVIVGVVAAGAAAAALFFLLSRVAPYFSLSASSPSGAGVPGLDQVFIWNVRANTVPTTINEVLFVFSSTDNAGSAWNTCVNLATSSKWAVYDDTGAQIDDSAAWVFYNSARVPCAGADVVAYARTTLSGGGQALAASTNIDNALWIDTTGASPSDDDAVQITIPNLASAVKWTDNRSVVRSASGLRNLPVTGGTILY